MNGFAINAGHDALAASIAIVEMNQELLACDRRYVELGMMYPWTASVPHGQVRNLHGNVCSIRQSLFQEEQE